MGLVFKYGLHFAYRMMAQFKTLIVLSVMLLAPAAGAIHFEQESDESVLDVAAKNWVELEPLDTTPSPLKLVDYSLNLEIGSFDPVIDDVPKSSLDDMTDYRNTGMAIIQLYHHTSEALFDVVDAHQLFVLDNLGGPNWLVRLPNPTAFSDLQHDENIRWSGPMMPGWRVSQDLSKDSNYVTAIPAADLIPEALEGLAHDFVMMGADEAWCGLHLCEIKGEINLESLARDGRVIWSEKATSLRLTNAVAGAIVGIPEVGNSSLGLDGSGEKISFTDTGIDRDHPDIANRVAGVYTQFGLDPSPADTNGGHGTHVALTLAGDGSGDSSARGIAPEAFIVAYALEHDPTGVFGRLGSIYDMLNHAEQEGSRVSVNAWGLNGNYGAYTADSRSVDVFVNDNPTFLPIFSAGDDANQDPSKVMAPSTAKNVISVGASTTNPDGVVANFSAQGPSIDGRVKPDLVAPGVNICSGRAEESAIPLGFSCASGTHSNGNNMYMSLSGASQATAVAGGSISLIREFIREEVGISTPTASLLKAAAINGAVDLGTPDIPNNQEGWGQISVVNTVMPSYSGTDLTTFHDNARTLSAGFSTLYQFDMDPSSGVDITLVWSDKAGSANTDQNLSKLVNDLDLKLVGPDGSIFKGNVIVNGFSVQNGVHDNQNNVERIKIAPSSVLPSGKWQVLVSHAGGLDQTFSMVITADATLDEKADLMTFDGSIFSSSESPLVNDLITIRLSWLNQGTADAGSYKVILQDLTEGTTLYEGVRSSLSAGVLDSLTIYHSFSTTGDHDMRLSVDSESQITEINDEINGINNNIHEMTITVSALGVRLVTLDSQGAEDESLVNQTLNPSESEGFTWPVVLKHEGTETQSVKLQLSQVQSPSPIRDDMLLPTEDKWSRYSDLSGPFTLSPMDQGGDKMYLNITMNDDDADLSGQTDRYAMAGTYVMDVTAKYSNNPSVKHTIRLRLVVEEVKDVQVAPAGTSGLEAVPGGSTSFSMSVRNTGNSPAIYDLDCYSENRWQVQLGQSNSSSYSFEPLDILEYLPMQVRLYVPPVVDGLPAAGSTDSVTCSVTSETDPSLNISETVVLTVKALESFATNLLDDNGIDVGPAATARDINVDTGERLNLTLLIENTGNTQLDLTVRVNPELTTWTIQVSSGTQTENREVQITISPGETDTVRFEILVSPVAVRDDENSLVIKITQDPSNFLINETTLVVKDEIGMSITSELSSFNSAPNGDFVSTTLQIENTGNSGVSVEWAYSLPPDGWEVGFANPPSYLGPRESTELQILIKAPINQEADSKAFELGVYATLNNGFEDLQVQFTQPVEVISGGFCSIIYDENSRPLLGIERGGSATQTISILNIGNQPLDIDLNSEIEAKLWNVDLSQNSITELGVGESRDIIVTASSKEDTSAGIEEISITCGDNEVILEMSVQNSQKQGGLFGILPPVLAYSIIGVVLLGLAIVARRIKKAAPKDYSGEELVAPDAHSIPDDGMRMQAVMDSVVSEESMASGGVSAEEIAAALAQSMPTLPTPPAPTKIPAGRPPVAIPAGRPPVAIPAGRPPVQIPKGRPPSISPAAQQPQQAAPQQPPAPPLPPGGLPPGWTMEQWRYYGHQWLANQGQQ